MGAKSLAGSGGAGGGGGAGAGKWCGAPRSTNGVRSLGERREAEVGGGRPRLVEQPAALGRGEQQRAEVEARHGEEGRRVQALAQRHGLAQTALRLIVAPEDEVQEGDAAPDRAALPCHHVGEGRDATAGFDITIRHHSALERTAMVTDQEWLVRAARLMAWMAPGEFKVFPTAELEQATAWISG
jgi:hypothetical protein